MYHCYSPRKFDSHPYDSEHIIRFKTLCCPRNCFCNNLFASTSIRLTFCQNIIPLYLRNDCYSIKIKLWNYFKNQIWNMAAIPYFITDANRCVKPALVMILPLLKFQVAAAVWGFSLIFVNKILQISSPVLPDSCVCCYALQAEKLYQIPLIVSNSTHHSNHLEVLILIFVF